jgi:hypothetical protein
MYYWISWVQTTDDVRPIGYPPNEAVLGWWSTGYTDDGQTLCAMVRADSEQDARAVIWEDWPEADQWRFCEQQKTLELGDRFPLADWMRPRFEGAERREEN